MCFALIQIIRRLKQKWYDLIRVRSLRSQLCLMLMALMSLSFPHSLVFLVHFQTLLGEHTWTLSYIGCVYIAPAALPAALILSLHPCLRSHPAQLLPSRGRGGCEEGGSMTFSLIAACPECACLFLLSDHHLASCVLRSCTTGSSRLEWQVNFLSRPVSLRRTSLCLSVQLQSPVVRVVTVP